MGEEVAKLLPQGLLVEVVRAPCLGVARPKYVVISVACSVRMVIMVDKVEDT